MINYLIYITRFILEKFNVSKDTDFFSSPPQFTDNFRSNELAQHAKGSHCIESLTTLKTLLIEKNAMKQPPSIRFLVDITGTVWFANETFPEIKAPKHFQMTGMAQKNSACKTAGNLKFTDSSCTVLRNITHQSGDFHPAFSSLKWLLAILYIHETALSFKLPRVLVIKELDTQGKLRKKHYWPTSRIKRWITTFSDNNDLMRILNDQNKSARVVHYTCPNHNVLNHADSARALNLVNSLTCEACSPHAQLVSPEQNSVYAATH